jgi:galactonate dehydratase
LGKPATAFEVLRQSLLTIPNLQAAINMALLDVVGRFVKAPVYQLLGGPTRFKVRVLAALDGPSDDDLLASLERLRTAGHRAFLAPIPPVRAPNQGQAFVRAVVKRLERLRAAGGDDLDFVLDAAGALSRRYWRRFRQK